MKIITFEGLDKSGKHTQSIRLTERLKREGYSIIHSEFHRYDTPTGKLIRDWLDHKYNADQKTIELIMAADKQAQQAWFEELEKQNVDFLILDRYTTSQIVYAMANGIPKEWIDQLQRYLRKPDIEIFIDIKPETSLLRKGKYGENDRYESNLELLKKVRELYFEFITEKKNFIIVNGENDRDHIEMYIWNSIKRIID